MSVVPAPIEFGSGLRDDVAGRLARHRRVALPLDGRRHAAVAILLVDSQAGSDDTDRFDADGDVEWDMSKVPAITDEQLATLDGRMVGVAGGASFVLCRRSSGLRAHAAQWALPGGRIDDGETVEQAALRETHEEVGIELPESAVLGMLDDYATRSGYVITPVVVWGGGVDALAPNPSEVLAAYRIGLHNLQRDDSPRFITIPESDRPVVQVPLGGDLVHAPTGALLVQFRWVCLDGRLDERVGHLEQPVFAWG